jgi:hypothetical protein
MSVAESHTAVDYDDIACRKHLAKAIAAHQAKLAELADLRAAISQAEAKLAGLQETIEKSAHVEDQVAELAADALRSGRDVSERSPAWKAKEKRDDLIADHKLLMVGFERLRARASGLENEVEAEHVELLRVREPIIQNMLSILADELAMKESEAATLRARLYGFSVCSNGPVLQKLPWLARNLLGNQPQNAAHPQTNSVGHFKVQKEKSEFIAWKKQLESDADARLNLD